MICPKCQAGRGTTSVLDARPVNRGAVTRRRLACGYGHRWTTYEVEASAISQLRYLAKVGARYLPRVRIPGFEGRWAEPGR